MKRGLQGEYVTISTVGERARAFVPVPLPPKPPIAWTAALRGKFDQALLELGRLDSVSALLPDTSLLLYTAVRKEAALSSMIEGTQSSLSDLLLHEMEEEPGVPLRDVREVSRYVAALEHGLRLLAEGLPLSLRLLRQMHGVLLGAGRGSRQTPGRFRRSQNWIGGSRPGNAAFVPPPADKVLACMGALELFLNDRPLPTPVLLKAALAHVQFETIHPFLDGNGRLGRLLITVLLHAQKVLRQPTLYLSGYFKTHRRYYYELLGRARLRGEWEAWLDFFADAVIATATDAADTARQILAMADADRGKIARLGRAAASAERVQRALLERPIATSRWLSEHTGLTPATVNKALESLRQLGIITELTARKRGRLFRYSGYIELMNRGMGLPRD